MSGQKMTEGWEVRPCHGEEEQYYVSVPRKVACRCDCPSCSGWKTEHSPHTNGMKFDDASDAYDWIEQVAENYEDQYDQYLEENSHQIAQMERREAWLMEH